MISNTRECYSLEMSADSKWLLVTVYQEEAQDLLFSESTEVAGVNRSNRFYAMDVSSCKGSGGNVSDLKALHLLRLIDGEARNYCWQYIANIDSKFWFRTNYGAEHFRVVSLILPSQSELRSLRGVQAIEACMLQTWQNVQECIPEDKVCLLESASVAARSVLVLKYRRRQHHEVVLYDLNATASIGGNRSLRPAAELPTSQCDGIEGPWSDFHSSSIFYRTTNFADPGCVWRAKVSRDNQGSIFLSFEPLYSPVVPGFNMHDYETAEECFPFDPHAMLPPGPEKETEKAKKKMPIPNSLTTTGAAGTALMHLFAPRIRDIHGSVAGSVLRPNRPRRVSRVGGSTALGSSPLSSTSTDTRTEDESRSCVLFVYGGFGMDYTPAFSSALGLFSKHYGAIVAVLRVDISKEPEHAAAAVLAASEHLVARGLTSLRRLGLLAGTSGASVCAIALNRRPDLFGAAVLQDGLYDFLRLKQLNPPREWCLATTAADVEEQSVKNESRWEEEFGCASASSQECKDLLTLSPLHNVRAYWVRDDELSYPAVLLQSSLHSTVNVSHSYKFTAQLQRIWGSNDRADNPILLDNTSTSTSLGRTTEALSFLATYTKAEYNDKGQ
jgi:protease II